jgi:hypothetical protein
MKDLQDKTPTEVFEELDKKNKEGIHTFGSMGDAMSEIRRMSLNDLESAQKIANLYVEGAAIHQINSTQYEDEPPATREDAISIVKQNIGYICGYYGPEMAQFWYPTINTTHPIFGNTIA